jgi:hypothetical protein
MGHPRTPVYFPKMKVRGARNKWKMIKFKVNYRVRAFPYLQLDGSYRFDIHPEGTHIIVASYYRDGWGRSFGASDG